MSYSYGDEVVQDVVSNCCGSQVVDIDICDNCKEHCDLIKDEDD
jgi:hypothetical protein